MPPPPPSAPWKEFYLLDIWSIAQYKYNGSAFFNMHAMYKILSESLKGKRCLVTGSRTELNQVDEESLSGNMRTFQRVRGHGTFKEINFKILSVHMFSFLKLIILRKYANLHFLPQITTDVPKPTSDETPPPTPTFTPPWGREPPLTHISAPGHPQKRCANQKSAMLKTHLSKAIDL